ncbi:MAG: exosortase/archaeosortase family protein [Spartobacteria bacterium]
MGTGLIGIEEACNGVRSLQATFMISLFLGDLYSFNIKRRVFLVLAGALFALICNLVRTAILVWVGAHRGASAIESWHDPAGMSILLICLFGLWLLSLFMRRNSEPPLASAKVERSSAGSLASTGPIFAALAVGLLLPKSAFKFGIARTSRRPPHRDGPCNGPPTKTLTRKYPSLAKPKTCFITTKAAAAPGKLPIAVSG